MLSLKEKCSKHGIEFILNSISVNTKDKLMLSNVDQNTLNLLCKYSKHLKRLTIRQSTDLDLSVLESLEKLTHLSLSYCKNVTLPNEVFTNKLEKFTTNGTTYQSMYFGLSSRVS